MATIKVIGLLDGQPTEYDGKFVVDYDPTPRLDEEGVFVHLLVTEDAGQARQFPSSAEAVNFYMQASRSGPRDDGQPDRPLTAYTVEIS